MVYSCFSCAAVSLKETATERAQQNSGIILSTAVPHDKIK